MDYIEYVIGHPKFRASATSTNSTGGKCHVRQVKTLLEKYPNTPIFRSYFTVSSDFLDTKYHNLSEYEGARDLFRNKISLDFDNEKEGVEEVLNVIGAHDLLSLDNIQLWMSGGKGFHLDIPNWWGLNPHRGLHDHLIGSLEHLFGTEIMKGVDLSFINPAGLFRLETSARENGHHKMPITIEEFFGNDWDSLVEFQDAYKDRKGFKYAKVKDAGAVLNTGKSLFPTRKPKKKADTGGSTMFKTPKYICMSNLISSKPKEGQRHNDMLALSAWFNEMGMPLEVARTALLEWAPKELAPEANNILENSYRRGYWYSCDHTFMKRHCGEHCSSCKFYNRTKSRGLVTLPDAYSILKKYVQSENVPGINLLTISDYDCKLPLGTIAMFTGDTGMGKSALVSSLILNGELKTLYLSLEMSEELTIRRFVQGALRCTKDEIYEMVETSENLIREAMSKIDVSSKMRTLGEIYEAIDHHGYQCIVIDTDDELSTEEKMDDNIAARNRYTKLIKLAEEKNVLVILVHHLSKSGADQKRISLNALTGSRSNVTKMSFVFAIESPGDPKKNKMRTITALKVRDGEASDYQFTEFDWHTMKFKKPSATSFMLGFDPNED